MSVSKNRKRGARGATESRDNGEATPGVSGEYLEALSPEEENNCTGGGRYEDNTGGTL